MQFSRNVFNSECSQVYHVTTNALRFIMSPPVLCRVLAELLLYSGKSCTTGHVQQVTYNRSRTTGHVQYVTYNMFYRFIIVFNTDTTAVRLPDNTTTIKLTLIS